LADLTIRERIFPQMTAYDLMPPGRTVPFAMLTGPCSHRSDVVNTDAHGFRWTTVEDQTWTTEKVEGLRDVGVIVGGSTAFGVGSTGDTTTLSSNLARAQGSPWLNLGVRGGVSFQELIHTLRFLHRIDSVGTLLLFSGVNDTYINLLHDQESEFDRRFEERNSLLSFYSWQRQALSSTMASVSRFQAEELVAEPIGRILTAPFRRRQVSPRRPALDLSQKIDRIHQLARRNFLTYAALGSQLNARVVFVLQPFLTWTKKPLSEDEREVMDFLLQQQEGSAWAENYSILRLESTYTSVLEAFKSAADEFGISFVDSNPHFRSAQTFFVDHVHLNDEGYALASKLVKEVLDAP
jgi:hypothetical protein